MYFEFPWGSEAAGIPATAETRSNPSQVIRFTPDELRVLLAELEEAQ